MPDGCKYCKTDKGNFQSQLCTTDMPYLKAHYQLEASHMTKHATGAVVQLLDSKCVQRKIGADKGMFKQKPNVQDTTFSILCKQATAQHFQAQ